MKPGAAGPFTAVFLFPPGAPPRPHPSPLLLPPLRPHLVVSSVRGAFCHG